jgi:excisionase family DNA binding protein
MPTILQRRLRVPHFRPRDKILTLREAAKILGVSRHTAYIWAATGRIPARQLGPMFFVREKDIRLLVNDFHESAIKRSVRDPREPGLTLRRRKPTQ